MIDGTQKDYEFSSRDDKRQRPVASKGGQASYIVWYEFESDEKRKDEEEEDQK